MAVAAAAHRDELALHRDPSLVGHFQQVDAAQERALSRAAAAEDGDHVVAVRRERDALEDFVRTEALVKVLDDERDGRSAVHARAPFAARMPGLGHAERRE